MITFIVAIAPTQFPAVGTAASGPRPASRCRPGRSAVSYESLGSRSQPDDRPRRRRRPQVRARRRRTRPPSGQRTCPAGGAVAGGCVLADDGTLSQVTHGPESGRASSLPSSICASTPGLRGLPEPQLTGVSGSFHLPWRATNRSIVALCDHRAWVMAVTPANYLGPRNRPGKTQYRA
jgi:hypothetical protein